MNSPSTIICFFDLDNTLLDDLRDEIPDSTLTALKKLRERGTVIVISTGRDMDTHYSVKYRDIVRPDAIIHQNGNRISVGDKVIFDHRMDRVLLKEIYNFCKEKGICIGTSIKGEDFFLYPEKKTQADLSYKKFSVRNFVPFEEIFRRGTEVNALSYAGNIQVDKPMIEERFPGIELFPFSGSLGADVVEKGFSKAEGLKKIADYYGSDIEDTYAFGDSSNDIPILKAAGTGIAMGNADESAKAAADYITDDIRHDGIYNALVHFGLIEA